MTRERTPQSKQSMEQLVDLLDVGDVFNVFAGRFIVDEWLSTSSARPIAYIRKESVTGWMSQRYRLEPADPADPDGTELVIRAEYKNYFSEWSTFEQQEIDVEPTVTAETENRNASCQSETSA